MHVSEFDFELPDELVAQAPAPRGESRMLVLTRADDSLADARVRDLSRYLREGDLLVVNNTRVFAARLLGRRIPSGGAVECLLLGRAASPVGTAGGLVVQALVHPGQKLRPGARVRFDGTEGVLEGEILARHFHGRRTVRLWSDHGADVDALIDRIGHIPLPPYIKRPDTTEDRDWYQTVYARVRGSVAAPTAGLHFTPAMMASLNAAGIEHAEITLHVGYGTFKPVRTETVEVHTVDPEWYDIGSAAARAITAARSEGRRIIAVGTTTTRALEDAELRGNGLVQAGAATTSLFIYPGFTFRVIDGLLTNFHLPRSSLLMLVAAFAGRERVLRAYHEAIDRRYRFYSYGDAMLIL